MLLYVHYPFCRSKCAYCAFSSREHDPNLEELYFSSLLEEAEQWGRHLERPHVSTLYIGGGTPSLMRSDWLERLVESLDRSFVLTEGLELTLEANPDSLDSPERVRDLARIGVNRISLGLQSLDDDQLGLLQRPHTVRQGLRAVDAVRSGGIDNLGLDFLWGLPGQTVGDWIRHVKRAASLEPEHISCYGLTLEEGTRLRRRVEHGELELPGEDALEAMYLRSSQLLRDRGYTHYEIANFARQGAECRHNQGYWRGADYLGLGPSAVSTIRERRWTNPEDIFRYAEAVSTGDLGRHAEILTRAQRIDELVMLGLRTSEGLDLDRYRALAGKDLVRFRREMLRALEERGLIRTEEGRLRLTTQGMLLSDAVIGSLIGD